MEHIGVREAADRLLASGGGYDVVHESPGLEVGVYVLVAPEPDSQEPHDDDEIYVVLSGEAVLTVEGRETLLGEGDAAFVPTRAEHRFAQYERVALLVVFARPTA